MEQKKEEQFNLEEIKKKALEKFRSGKSLARYLGLSDETVVFHMLMCFPIFQ